MEVPLYGLLIVLSILFVGSLSAFLSALITEISHEKINELLEDDYKSAQILRDLQLQFEQNVSPFQILEITLYSIGAIVLGFYLHEIEFVWYKLSLFALVYIFFVLLFRYTLQAIGIRSSEKTAASMTILIQAAYLFTKPFCILFSAITKLIIGEREDDDTKDEIEIAVESAYSENALDSDEYKILKNTIKYSDVTAKEVMTPRTVIFSADIMTKVDDLVKISELQHYSRIPVWEGESIDDGVQGYVMTKDIVFAALNGKGSTLLDDYVMEIRFVKETDTLDEILERFIGSTKHMSMVIDEYGGITGLITMEDILENIIGEEIVDEADRNIDMRQLAKQLKDKKITKLS